MSPANCGVRPPYAPAVRQTGVVYSRLRFLIWIAAAGLLLAACSSTTVVARDERATATSAESAEAPDDSAAGEDTAGEDATDPGTTADDDSDATESTDDEDPTTNSDATDAEADRGGREDTPTPREVDVGEGFGLGGAEQLEGLLVDCQDGNDLACDILFQISAFDSEEEDAALTCGGRSDTEVTFCTDGIDAVEDALVFDPDSAALDRIIEACQVDGNMTACDFLYYRSPIDSEFQEIGGTCGGRVNVAIPDCRSIIDE